MPALDALTAEQFEWAMSLVHARYPGLPSGPGEEMQFDITCLDSLALRQLIDFTQACAKAAQVCCIVITAALMLVLSLTAETSCKSICQHSQSLQWSLSGGVAALYSACVPSHWPYSAIPIIISQHACMICSTCCESPILRKYVSLDTHYISMGQLWSLLRMEQRQPASL